MHHLSPYCCWGLVSSAASHCAGFPITPSFFTPPLPSLPSLADSHDDGDLMQLLFGVADEMPTMATIHLHKFSTPTPPAHDTGAAAASSSEAAASEGDAAWHGPNLHRHQPPPPPHLPPPGQLQRQAEGGGALAAGCGVAMVAEEAAAEERQPTPNGLITPQGEAVVGMEEVEFLWPPAEAEVDFPFAEYAANAL